MIIWSGWGWLVAVLAFLCSLGTQVIVDAANHDDKFYDTHTWPLVVAMTVAGLICLILGKKLNQKSNGHRFFFVPMQHWGIILPILGFLGKAFESAR